MQWTDEFDLESASNSTTRRRGIWRFLAMSCLTPVFVLVFVIGLCAFAAAVVRPVASIIAARPGAERTPLPALTPTSLPTFTPTANPVQEQGAAAASSAAFSPAAAAPSNGVQVVQPQTSTGGQPTRSGGAGAVTSSAYAPANPASANGSPVVRNNPAAPAGSSSLTSALAPTPRPPVGQPGNEVVIILPTTLPSPATPTATAAPPNTPTPAATATPGPVDSIPDDNSDSDNEDDGADEADSFWTFTGVRADTSLYQNGMLVYGTVVNNATTAQEIDLVSATFYDTQGHVIGEENHIQAYWPAYALPPDGASMPFQLLVNGLSGAADFNLSLDATSSSKSPREDFEFSELEQSYQSESYCVDGYLHNSGGPIQDYLIIAVVLYDKQENVVNFQDEQVYHPSKVVGDQPYHFKICVAPPYDDVARYDVQAWGY